MSELQQADQALRPEGEPPRGAEAARCKRLSGWGRVPWMRARELASEDLLEATRGAVLSRGLGRSYGDASLPPREGDLVASTLRADRVLVFDRERAILRAEAGLSLFDLNGILWPAGFACPVAPGTQFVTLGGMLASNVHGKNQHVAGCIGDHVRGLRLRVADGRVLEVGPEREPELFDATLGGMGLTGHILEVELELERIPGAWIEEQTRPVPDLGALVAGLREASRHWPFTVCWVDALRRGAGMGRGILRMGRWAEPHEAPRAVPRPRRGPSLPFPLPGRAMNRLTLAAANALYYRLQSRPRRRVVHPQAFFHPLDALQHWNRLYGRRGPIQYQCVLPEGEEERACRRFFETLTRMGGASFLSVVKDCGPTPRGLLSFPLPGISVALDLVMREGSTQRLIDALNEIVIEAGGRIYLTKDALTRPEHFRAMEGARLARFLEVRRKWDPERRLGSALASRLLGDA